MISPQKVKQNVSPEDNFVILIDSGTTDILLVILVSVLRQISYLNEIFVNSLNKVRATQNISFQCNVCAYIYLKHTSMRYYS